MALSLTPPSSNPQLLVLRRGGSSASSSINSLGFFFYPNPGTSGDGLGGAASWQGAYNYLLQYFNVSPTGKVPYKYQLIYASRPSSSTSGAPGFNVWPKGQSNSLLATDGGPIIPFQGFDWGASIYLSSGGGTDVNGILAGDYNSSYTSQLQGWLSAGVKNMWLRPVYEFNHGGDGSPYGGQDSVTASQFVQIWQYLHGVMNSWASSNGMTLTWCWNPLGLSNSNAATPDIRAWYPGNAYVDIHGVDIYNNCYLPSPYTTWPGFMALVNAAVASGKWSSVLAGGTIGAQVSTATQWVAGNNQASGTQDNAGDNVWHYVMFPQATVYGATNGTLQSLGGPSVGWTGGANGSSSGTSTSGTNNWGILDAIQWASYCGKNLCFPETGEFFSTNSSGTPIQWTSGSEAAAAFPDPYFWSLFPAMAAYAATLNPPVTLGPVVNFLIPGYDTDTLDYPSYFTSSTNNFNAAFGG